MAIVTEATNRNRVEEILDRIAASGGRRTMSRQAVIQVIVDCHGHITADAIAQEVQRDFPSVDVSTVYRTLDTLRELGVVDRVHFADGSTVYHLADHQHHHLLCESCGTTVELPMDSLEPLAKRVLAEHGFELHQRPVGLFGLCSACRRH